MAAVTDYPVRLPSDVGKFGEETPVFTKAFSESFKTGSCLPILKQELRLKIQNRRMLEGQPELQVKFEEAEKHPLTRREINKLESRKHHNRLSAKKCRVKMKAIEMNRSKELDELTIRNKNLWKQYHKMTQWKILLTKNLMKHIRTQDSNISEADFLTLLPDLLKVGQAEKNLFLKNNVVQSENTELQANDMSEWSSGLQQGTPCVHSAMVQHNNVLEWLQQCGEPDEIQAEVEVQTEPNTFVCPYGNPEIQSNFTLQQNADSQSNFALQQISEIQTSPLEEDPWDGVVHEHGLQQDCHDTAVIDDRDFPYQQTNAVLQEMDFLLSETA